LKNTNYIDSKLNSEYRFGFNGQEKDDEITGITGSHLDFDARIYDSRIGRFISADPLIVYGKKYPELSPYQFASNTPIMNIDLYGLQGTKPQLIEQPYALFKITTCEIAYGSTALGGRVGVSGSYSFGGYETELKFYRNNNLTTGESNFGLLHTNREVVEGSYSLTYGVGSVTKAQVRESTMDFTNFSVKENKELYFKNVNDEGVTFDDFSMTKSEDGKSSSINISYDFNVGMGIVGVAASIGIKYSLEYPNEASGYGKIGGTQKEEQKVQSSNDKVNYSVVVTDENY